MQNPTYYNGIVTPFNSAVIPLSDRSIFFGDCVYEVMIGCGEKVYLQHDHLSRLKSNCEAIGLHPPMSDDELIETISELISLSDVKEFSVYIQISGNSERRCHVRSSEKSNILISVNEISVPKSPNRIRAITLPDMRYRYCNLKTTNLLPAVLSMNEAQKNNADIAIFTLGQEVTECSHANIAILNSGKLKTPPLSDKILPGITRKTLLSLCEKLSIPYTENTIFTDELLSADAVLICSTTKLIQLCSEINGKSLEIRDEGLVNYLFDHIYKDFYEKK